MKQDKMKDKLKEIRVEKNSLFGGKRGTESGKT